MKHEERIGLARDLCTRLQDRYGDALLIAGVYGSTAAGTDTEWSDLELCFIIAGTGDAGRHILVRGVPVGWHLIDRANLEHLLAHPSAHWPFLMGMLSSLQILHGDSGLIQDWIALGESPPPERFTGALEEALPGLAWESFGRILSCQIRRNEHDILLPSVLEVLFEMVTALSLLNRRWSTHDYFQKLVDTFSFPLLPDDYETLATSLWEVRELDKAVSLSRRLVANFASLLKRNGVRVIDYAGAVDVPVGIV